MKHHKSIRFLVCILTLVVTINYLVIENSFVSLAVEQDETIQDMSDVVEDETTHDLPDIVQEDDSYLEEELKDSIGETVNLKELDQVDTVDVFKPQITEIVNSESGFRHPGVGLSAEMLNTVQYMVNEKENPWITYYEDMLDSHYSNKDITIYMNNPEGTSYNSQSTNNLFIKDALCAYTQAIQYYITGDNAYRRNCMNIIRQYEKLSTSTFSYFNDACIHTGIPMNRFCMAMEIMRYSDYEVTEGFTKAELEWTDSDTEKIIENFIRPSVDTFMSSNNEFMNQHLYTTIGAMSAYLFMDDVAGYEKTVEWFTVNKNGTNPGFNGSIERLFRLVTTIDEIGMKEGEGKPLENPVVEHVEMGRDQAHGCGDLTNAAILSRLTNGQGTLVDPVYGTVSDLDNAVTTYEFLDDRIIKAADFFFKYMLGYEEDWIQVPFSQKSDGTIIDNYTEFASGYRGRYSTINFWDLYTYYIYDKKIQLDDFKNKYPYFWEGFTKKMPSNFMWNGNLHINWENVDGGGDFWLFLPKEAKNDSNFLAKDQKDYIVEVEDRATIVDGKDKVTACNSDECTYLHFENSNTNSRIAITSGGNENNAIALKIRTDGVATAEFTNGMNKNLILPDTKSQWRYVVCQVSDNNSFGDLYYISIGEIEGSYVDIDFIDIKPNEINDSRYINKVSFENAFDEYKGVIVSQTYNSIDCKAVSDSNINYRLINEPHGASISKDGKLELNNVKTGNYYFYVEAYTDNTSTVKRINIRVADTRKEAINICKEMYDDSKIYLSSSKKAYFDALNMAEESIKSDDNTFSDILCMLNDAALNLKLVSPLLKSDAYSNGDSLDLNEIVETSSLGNIQNLVDSNATFCNRIDGKNNSHVIDFGQDYKVKASKFGFKARLGFADRIAGVQVWGSNDNKNWNKLTEKEADFTMAFQTLDVCPDEKDNAYRYYKIQKTTEYPESLRGGYSYMLEFSEFRVWGERVETGNEIESISLSSSKASLNRVKMNESVDVLIYTKNKIKEATVIIQGHEVEAKEKENNLWVASAVMESGTKAGNIEITTDYIKSDGSRGDTIYGTTDGSQLQLINSDIFIDTKLLAKRITATSGSWDKKSTPEQCGSYLFDGDTKTFGDLANTTGDYYVIDYGEDVKVSIKGALLMPRSTAANHASRLNGAVLYGTNDEIVFDDDGSFSEMNNKSISWKKITPAVSNASMNKWSEFNEDDILTNEEFRYIKIAGAQQGDIAEVEIYGNYIASIEKIAASITELPVQKADNKVIEYPTIPCGYTFSIAESKNKRILNNNGKIIAPKEDTEVNVKLNVIRDEDGTSCQTEWIPVMFKGIGSLIPNFKVISNETTNIFKEKQIEGYKLQVEDTSNSSIIKKSGKVKSIEDNQIVDISIRITRKKDKVSVVGPTQRVLVHGFEDSNRIDVNKLAVITCSDGSDASLSVFDESTDTFADLNINAFHELDFGEENFALIDKIRIYPRSDSNDNNARRTEGAILYGSNDRTNWVAVTKPIEMVEKGKWKEINAEDFLTIGEFRYLKIGGNTRGSMAEVELYGDVNNKNDSSNNMEDATDCFANNIAKVLDYLWSRIAKLLDGIING